MNLLHRLVEIEQLGNSTFDDLRCKDKLLDSCRHSINDVMDKDEALKSKEWVIFLFANPCRRRSLASCRPVYPRLLCLSTLQHASSSGSVETVTTSSRTHPEPAPHLLTFRGTACSCGPSTLAAPAAVCGASPCSETHSTLDPVSTATRT